MERERSGNPVGIIPNSAPCPLVLWAGQSTAAGSRAEEPEMPLNANSVICNLTSREDFLHTSPPIIPRATRKSIKPTIHWMAFMVAFLSRRDPMRAPMKAARVAVPIGPAPPASMMAWKPLSPLTLESLDHSRDTLWSVLLFLPSLGWSMEIYGRASASRPWVITHGLNANR